MSQTSIHPDDPLDAALRRAHIARRRAEAHTQLAFAAMTLLVLVFSALVLDAVLAFDPQMLIVIDLFLIVALLSHTAWMVRRWMKSRYDPQQLARLLEARLACEDNLLINAVQLAQHRPDAASAQLIDVVRNAAAGEAATIRPELATNPAKARRAFRGALLALVPFLALGVLSPRLLTMTGQRLLSPTAGLPPFSLLRFEVHASPPSVTRGAPTTIHAKVDGPFLPEQADVVFLNAEGRAMDRIPMARMEPNQFSLALDHVTEAKRYYVDTPGGRSYEQSITVVTEEPAKVADEPARLEALLADLASLRAKAEQVSQMRDRLDDFIDGLRELAAQMRGRAEPDSLDPLDAALQSVLNHEAATIESEANQLDSGASGEIAEALVAVDALARMLEQIHAELKQSADDKVAGRASIGSEALGLSGLELDALLEGSHSGGSKGEGVASTTPNPKIAVPGEAETVGLERMDGTTRGDDSAAALGPGVPLQYRELTEQYFKRLAEEVKK